MTHSPSRLQAIAENLASLSDERLNEVAGYLSRLRDAGGRVDDLVYRELIDELPNLVWQRTEQGETKYVNRRWRDYFGRSGGITDEEWKSVVHPDDFANFLGRWQTVNEVGLLDPLSLRLLRHDGEYRWFSKRARAVRDEAGSLDYWIFTATDIHATKQAEEALRVEEERLRYAVRAGQIGIWDYTPTDGSLQWDQGCRAAFGAGPLLTIDHDCFVRSLHPEDSERVQDLVAAALNPAGDGLFETDYRAIGLSDGIVRYVHSEGRTIFSGSGESRRPVRFLGVVKDITNRMRFEEELRQANLDLQQFAYAAAHDLQEPLRNISLSLGLLKMAHGSRIEESGMALIDTSIEGSQRIHGMITDLLAFTRVSTQSFSVTAEPVDLNEVLESVIANLQTAILESGAVIRSAVLPMLAMHETHVVQLFQNIIGNAIKYQRPGQHPMIEVTAERVLGDWQIAIADNGIGFDPMHQERIFGVFKRLHHRHEYPGSGIGLAICSRIISCYGGRIWAQGKVNEGATIFFTLPAQRS